MFQGGGEGRFRFVQSEWAGAFGDLGTLLPFVVGYLTVLKLDPRGVLLMFGLFLIVSGLYYRTPMPIQPMKAIGGAAIGQASSVTAGMVWGAGLFTGLLWLVLGFTGALDLIALAMALLLLGQRHVPAMFALIVFGVAAALVRNPGILAELARTHWQFRLPAFALGHLTWPDMVKGTLILGIPQVPLTLGNAVIAITAENNRLFPGRPVTEKKVALFQGVMNLVSPLFGGVPMCHGAGGMAGHVRFGARTGGAPLILGTILTVVALGLGGAVLTIFRLFPASVLGVILFLAGLELAVASGDTGAAPKTDYYVLLVTAGLALWNMGVAFLAGIIMQEMVKRRIFRL